MAGSCDERRRDSPSVLALRRPPTSAAVAPRGSRAPVRQCIQCVRDSVCAEQWVHQPRSGADRRVPERRPRLGTAARERARVRDDRRDRRRGRGVCAPTAEDGPMVALRRALRLPFWSWFWLLFAAGYFLLPLYSTLQFSLQTSSHGYGFAWYGSILHDPG